MKLIHDTVWPVVKLKVVCFELQPGFAREPNELKTGILQLRMPNVSRNGFIDFTVSKHVTANDSELKKYSVQRGDVIFNNTNSPELVGNAAVFDHGVDCVLSNHMTRIRVNQKLVLPAFLAAVLHSYWKTGQTQSKAKQWVNQAAVDTDCLRSFSMPLPLLSEQRRIVEILQEAEEIRRLRAEAESKTAALIPALFFDFFGDLYSDKTSFPVKLLSQIGELDRGRSRHRPRDEPSLYGGPYPFVQTGDIAQANGWVSRFTQTYSEKGLEQSWLWPKGTLAITIAANIGSSAILAFDACFPDSVVGFTPRADISVEFVRWWLLGYQKKLEMQAPQGAQKNINLEVLRAIKIPVPPPDLQERFRTAIHYIRDQMNSFELSVKSLPALSASINSEAFSGQLTAHWREKNADKLAAEARERDVALSATGSSVARPVLITEAWEPAVAPLSDLPSELTPEQLFLYSLITKRFGNEASVEYFSPQSLEHLVKGRLHRDCQAIEGHLVVLAARGLVIPVSREEQAENTGEYVFGNTYRLPLREKKAKNGDEAVFQDSDYARLRELERLAAVLGRGGGDR